MIRTFGLAVLAATMVPSAASAVTVAGCPRCAVYDYVANFGASVFQYGTGNGATFTPYAQTFATGCFGVDMRCFTNGDGSTLPQIGKPNSGAVAFQTVAVPQDTLFLHPGTGDNTVLQFTAPGAGDYVASGLISRLDTTSNGNGVTVSVFLNGVLLPGASFTFAPSSGTATQPRSFNVGRTSLNAGDTLRLVIGNNGEYTYDSTGLTGFIANLPEPTTWVSLVGGFGVIGGVMRRRVRPAARTA